MIKNLSGIAQKLQTAVKEFTDIAVVGVSGGVDSATVAAICVAALGKENVYLVSMPYDQIDLDTFNARSAELAKYLGANHLVVPIGKTTTTLVAELEQAIVRDIDQNKSLHHLVSGNTRARMRMSILYAVAGELSVRFGGSSAKRVRVMGTGNASEDLIGYDTKGGDALADIFIIGDLFKSEVYQLAAHYNVPKSILEAEPSAGLYPGQTDEEELGYDYNTLEAALRGLHAAISSGLADGEIHQALPYFKEVSAETAEFVIRRFKANSHKHRAPVLVSLRTSDLVE